MQVSILGCGWLGLPLAKSLSAGNVVKGSVTSAEKLDILRQSNILPYQVDLNAPVADAVTGFLAGSDVLIICIPPKVKAGEGLPYPEKIQLLLPFIKEAGIKKILFTSSISVYAEDEAIPQVDETTTPNPENESGKQVWAAEQVLQSCADFKATILRLGGLTGGDRHPVYHLAGKAGLQNPGAPINLVSLDEVLAVILSVLVQDVWNETFVVVNPQHPTREEYYIKEAAVRGLPLPGFDTAATGKGKLVHGQEKILRLLNYRL